MSETKATALPAIPDDDADFTPEIARKTIAIYQGLLSDWPALIAERDALKRRVEVMRERLFSIEYATSKTSLSASEKLQAIQDLARAALSDKDATP